MKVFSFEICPLCRSGMEKGNYGALFPVKDKFPFLHLILFFTKNFSIALLIMFTFMITFFSFFLVSPTLLYMDLPWLTGTGDFLSRVCQQFRGINSCTRPPHLSRQGL